MNADPYAEQRAEMVTQQMERRNLNDPRLLAVLRRLPRHLFVPEELRSAAYADHPLPIGSGQTISQPYMTALMSSLLHLAGTENVLEIGTGSGYQAAVLAGLAAQVHTCERHAGLAEQATRILTELSCGNVSVHVTDGGYGWPDAAPYQGILVTAAASAPPPPLLAQVAEGGRLVIPIGSRGYQVLQVWQRRGERFDVEDILPVVFVPLRGSFGWSETDWPSDS
jgi:protein-L-isoaspartate(D-aspartate) O-methyltransferase